MDDGRQKNQTVQSKCAVKLALIGVAKTDTHNENNK